jgi:hypothetical protein
VLLRDRPPRHLLHLPLARHRARAGHLRELLRPLPERDRGPRPRGRADRPIFEEGVVLYPNSAVIGRCHLRKGTLVAQGQSIIDGETPGDCVVFNNAGALVFKKPKLDALRYFFRLEDGS